MSKQANKVQAGLAITSRLFRVQTGFKDCVVYRTRFMFFSTVACTVLVGFLALMFMHMLEIGNIGVIFGLL